MLRPMSARSIWSYVSVAPVALELGNDLPQSVGDFFGWSTDRKPNRRPNSNHNLTAARNAPPFAPHLPHAVEPHRHNRHIQILGKQPHPTLKFVHLAGLGVVSVPFWENKHTIATIDRRTRKSKALSKSGMLR
jgi:hypothetical protein